MGGFFIGTAGWSYPHGEGAWSGVFCREGVKGRDQLAFYARFFNAVEVNSTFYRPSSPRVSKGWADRTPEGFTFTAKAWQKFTNPKMFEEMAGGDPTLGQEDYDTFKRGLNPLMQAGELGVSVLCRSKVDAPRWA